LTLPRTCFQFQSTASLSEDLL